MKTFPRGQTPAAREREPPREELLWEPLGQDQPLDVPAHALRAVFFTSIYELWHRSLSKRAIQPLLCCDAAEEELPRAGGRSGRSRTPWRGQRSLRAASALIPMRSVTARPRAATPAGRAGLAVNPPPPG